MRDSKLVKPNFKFKSKPGMDEEGRTGDGEDLRAGERSTLFFIGPQILLVDPVKGRGSGEGYNLSKTDFLPLLDELLLLLLINPQFMLMKSFLVPIGILLAPVSAFGGKLATSAKDPLQKNSAKEGFFLTSTHGKIFCPLEVQNERAAARPISLKR